MRTIPVFVPAIGENTQKHLAEAFRVGWLGMGATTKDFEDRIAKFLEVDNRFVVATNTGTSALHIALRAAGIGPGDEVITPSFNYVADHQAIRMAGARAVMCDIREEDLGIDCKKAEQLITKDVKAIIPLHFAGIPCDQGGVYALAKKYKLRVIEDAMHAFGTTIDGKKIGSGGDITCFSFDPVKIITSIDGGCVVVNSKQEVEALHRLRLLGVDKDTAERYKNKRAWDYDVLSEGYRYHLTNIMASIGVSQIEEIDEFISSRRAVCRLYNEAFSALKGFKIPATDFSNVSPFIYSVRVLNNNRDRFIDHMGSKNIDVGIHFIPVHKHTFFAQARRGDMTVTERICKEVVTLPLHSRMDPESVQRIIEGVTSFKV